MIHLPPIFSHIFSAFRTFSLPALWCWVLIVFFSFIVVCWGRLSEEKGLLAICFCSSSLCGWAVGWEPTPCSFSYAGGGWVCITSVSRAGSLISSPPSFYCHISTGGHLFSHTMIFLKKPNCPWLWGLWTLDFHLCLICCFLLFPFSGMKLSETLSLLVISLCSFSASPTSSHHHDTYFHHSGGRWAGETAGKEVSFV